MITLDNVSYSNKQKDKNYQHLTIERMRLQSGLTNNTLYSDKDIMTTLLGLINPNHFTLLMTAIHVNIQCYAYLLVSVKLFY